MAVSKEDPMDHISELVCSNHDDAMVINDSISIMRDVNEQTYTHGQVEMVLNHLISKQNYHYSSLSSSIKSQDFIDEANKLGFNVLPEGKDIHG